jgi:AcrR family transcriptional regulator
MTEYASRGDPKWTMALLWDRVQAPSRGPKQGLAVADIVATAVEMADTEGLAAVSMRKVAERVGKSAMSLYTYVPGKAELLDLMLDHVLGELALDYTSVAKSDGWRAAVEACAREALAFYERHPWVLRVSGSRAVLGPHELDVFEAQLRLFDGLGLTGVEMSRAVSALGGYMRGSAKAVADAQEAERATGLSDDEWWNARAPQLDEMVDDTWPERYPTISRLSEEQTFDQLDREPDDATPYTVREALDAFEFGLQRLIDGFEALVASRNGDQMVQR